MKMKRATYRHIEAEIYSYYDTLKAIEELRASVEADSADKAVEELKQFLRFLKKSPTREFNFREVPVVYADVLNKFVVTKDYDSARWYAERYLA